MVVAVEEETVVAVAARHLDGERDRLHEELARLAARREGAHRIRAEESVRERGEAAGGAALRGDERHRHRRPQGEQDEEVAF